MPEMSRKIEGCAYNPEVHVLAFHLKDIGIVVERNQVLINRVKNKEEAKMIIDWLARIVNSSGR
jgi:ArsR family metal-binding transcriptional regulator